MPTESQSPPEGDSPDESCPTQYDPVHIPQQQTPRQQEQDLQEKQVAVLYTHAQYQQLAAELCEAKKQLQIERAQEAELKKAFVFQELNRKDLERDLSGALEEVRTLAREAKDLRIENVNLRLETARLKRLLTDPPITLDSELTQTSG